MKRAALLFVAACGGSSSATAPAQPAAAPVVDVCPRFVDPSQPWAADVFPGCAPVPLEFPVAVCGGECAEPCEVDRAGAAIDGAGNLVLVPMTLHVSYDGGRLATISTELGGRRQELRCSATGCQDDRGDAMTYDVAAGHITAIHAGDQTVKIEYRGNRATLLDEGERKITFDYDARGRLVTEHLVVPGEQATEPNDTKYTYDERGRLTARRGPGMRELYTYDAQGRASRIALHVFPTYDKVTDYKFDDRGRPIQAVSDDGRGKPETVTWRYDCK